MRRYVIVTSSWVCSYEPFMPLITTSLRGRPKRVIDAESGMLARATRDVAFVGVEGLPANVQGEDTITMIAVRTRSRWEVEFVKQGVATGP